MERKTLAITAPLLLSAMCFHLRGAFGSSKVLGFLLLLSCLLLPFTASESCSVNALHNPAECDSCSSPGYNPLSGLQDFSVGDASSSYAAETRQSVQSVCTSSHSFCFLSSLGSGNQSDPFYSLGVSNPRKSWSDKNWTSDYDVFELTDGRKVSCSLSSQDAIPLSSSARAGSANKNSLSECGGPLLKNKNGNPGMTKSDSFEGSSSFSVEINPPVLDWGEKFLFFPSVAFLTVENKCNDSILDVYEPFSTDKQFYPCNNTGFLLSPGEAASVCFMFVPRWSGLSSAHLVLQTNRGGFLVQAKGFAVKSLYGAQPLVSIAIPANPWSMKNFSVFNPLNEPLFVKGVTAWISISSENASLHTQVNCLVENHEILPLGIKDQLIVKSSSPGAFQMVAVKPYGSWEIGPGKREGILEMELLPKFEGRISGTVSLQLLRSSKEEIDTIVFPLEVKKVAWNDHRALVSVFLEPLASHDAAEMTIAISLKNDGPYMLAVVNVSKVADTSLFHIKHSKGLLLFPGSVTQVALISCAQLPSALVEPSDINRSCVVLVLTNDSSNPEVEILCRDVFHICSRNKKDSSNTKAGFSGSDMSSSSQIKAHSDDELILVNWKSQGIRSNLSVLKEHEVTFPVVQVGTHGSRYITVKNPSQEPVVMQFVLNSGEMIDECKGEEDEGLHSSPSVGSVESKGLEIGKHAFSVAESAVTEAYVYPNSETTFGPIYFQPSKRCRWRSSALIRNNLSGVEWISLKGIGGSLSLILVENSEPVHSLEFQPDLTNMSPPLGTFFHTRDTMCYKPLSKELYAKNTGDLPLEVQSISVSGTRCGGDGFVVNQCRSFSLEPGESSGFHLSYHMDLSASTVHRDLEFGSESGVILTVPVKASIPVLMLNLCKRSVFWVRLKKFTMAVLLAAASLFLLLYFVFPQMTAIISHDHRFYENSKRSCNRVAMRRAEKTSSSYQEKHNSFAISPEMDSLLRSMREETLGRMINGGSEKGSISVEAEEASAQQASEQPVNLTVKTVRDKKKRRRKRKGAITMTLGLTEVSSSHSGNSTPTSPISPAISAAPEAGDHPFRGVDPPGSAPPRAAKPSVLSHSATFPCAATRSANVGRSSSPLAPHARAAGEESGKRKEEKWYDMWGDHLKGLNLMDRFKEVRAGRSSGFGEDDDSESFFVKGPQSFLASSQSHPRYASLFCR